MDSNYPFVLVHSSNNISSVLNQPLTHTQRIKYICFDVSQTYIVMGASSGGLYLFNREPCFFIQLIPNQEGSVSCVAISPNEKMFAFATVKGLICLLHYNAVSKTYNQDIYREHISVPITCIKWNVYSTELFVGDANGKLSVVTISDIISKTMFQLPCFPLMKLDSAVIQLEWSCNLLLVSTMTRCYICDTEREEYRQIGQKLRDCELGACFINTSESDTSIEIGSTSVKKRGLFTSASDSQKSTQHSFFNRLKIYCARPGARLWEVQIDGTVVRTHEYKAALSRLPNEIILHNTSTDLRLQFLPMPEILSNNSNFSKVLVLRKKYLLTYKSDCLYVLDPEQSDLVLWCKCFKDIIDVRVLGSYIYLWNSFGNILVLFFGDLEKLLVKCFINKQYLFCADLCQKYLSDLLKIANRSAKLYLLSNLDKKLKEAILNYESIMPLLNILKEKSEVKQIAQKLDSGIYIVDNNHLVAQQIEEISTSASGNQNVQDNNQSGDSELANSPKLVVNQPHSYHTQINSESNEAKDSFTIDFTAVPCKRMRPIINSASDKSTMRENLIDSIETQFRNDFSLSTECLDGDTLSFVEQNIFTVYQYYKLSRVSKTMNCPTVDEIIKGYENINDLYDFLQSLETHISNEEGSFDNKWNNNLFLRYIYLQDLPLIDFISNLDPHLKQYLMTSFVGLNENKSLACECGFPLPIASRNKSIQYLEIGDILFEIVWREDPKTAWSLCAQVPFMWRSAFNYVESQYYIILLLQYNDQKSLEVHLEKFKEANYFDLIRKYIKFKLRKCLNCEKKYEADVAMSWTEFAELLLKYVGSEKTVEYLLKFSESIPKKELDPMFYQICLLSSLSKSEDVNKLCDIKPNELSKKLENVLIKAFQMSQRTCPM